MVNLLQSMMSAKKQWVVSVLHLLCWVLLHAPLLLAILLSAVARLVIADWFKIDQKSSKNRLVLCIPLLAAGAFIGHLDYTIVWRYFSWTNQTLAMIVLWTASMYLYKEKKNYWITAVPATFMSAVSMTYFFYAKECLNLGTKIAYPVGIVFAVVFLGLFLRATRKKEKQIAQ